MVIDIRTIFLVYVIITLLGVVSIFSLWLQNRRRFPEIFLWLVFYILQFFALVFMLLRGIIPDFISIVIANTFLIAGITAQLAGLQRYLGTKSRQMHNIIIIAVFTIIHFYFSNIHPSLAIRNINISAGIMLICVQGFWLTFFRVRKIALRSISRAIGLVFLLYCVNNFIHIIDNLINPPSGQLFNSGNLNALVLFADVAFFTALTLLLILLVNRRASEDLKREITLHKIVADELRQSEDKFSKAFQMSQWAISITRLEDGKIIEVNDAFVAMSGYSREGLYKDSTIGLKLWYNEKDREKMISMLQKKSSIHDEEFVFRKRNGKLLTGIVSAQIISLPEGRCILSSILDISERKKMAEEIEHSEEKLREAQEIAKLGNWELDLKDNVLTWSEGIYEIFELDPLNFGASYEAFLDTIHPDDREKVNKAYTESVRIKAPYEISHRLLMKDGRIKWVNEICRTYYDEQGNPWKSVGVVQDITELKQVEEELRDNRRFLEELIDNSSTVICVKDVQGRFELVNKKWEEYTGYDRQFAIGKTDQELFPGESGSRYYTYNREVTESGITKNFELIADKTDKNEQNKYLLFTMFPVRNDNNEITGVCAIGTDITERKQAEELLATERQQLAYILEATDVGTWEWNLQTNDIVFNERWAEIIGYTLEDLEPVTSETPSKFMHPDDFEMARKIFDKHLENRVPYYECEVRMRHKNGYWIWVLDKGKVVSRTKEGKPLIISGADMDITARKQTEKLLTYESQRLEYILEGTNAGIWEWNFQTGVFNINERWAEMIGYTLEELDPITIETPERLIHPDDFKLSNDLLVRNIQKEIPYYECEFRMRHKNGNWLWILDRGKVVTWTDDGEPLLICGTYQDINSRKLAEEKILHMATHDALTGLPSLKLAKDRLSVAMRMARRHKNKVAVMFTDLDGFKDINDTLGHAAGDFVLKQVAERLRSSIRETDTVARVGGDEFLIVAAELHNTNDAELIAKKANRLVSQPFHLNGNTVNISVSIGIAFCSEECANMEELIKQADEAMYSVKRSGKNNFAFANSSE